MAVILSARPKAGAIMTDFCTVNVEEQSQETAGEVVRVVEEWSAAHPRKTRQSVFLEQWPEAIVGDNGVLAIDSCKVEKTIKCNGMDCSKCRREFWMQEVE